MSKPSSTVFYVIGVIMCLVLVTSCVFLERSDRDFAKSLMIYDRQKRAATTDKNPDVYYCNEDIKRTCVCSGCSSMSTSDKCCMDVHNMTNIVQGILVRFPITRTSKFDDVFEAKFREVIRENTIQYCGLNVTRLEECGFQKGDKVAEQVLIKDVVFNKIYETENYDPKIDKYKIFRDLNIILLVYRTRPTNRRRRAVGTNQTDWYVSQNALKSMLLNNVTLIEKELGVKIGLVRVWDPRPRPFTQREIAFISIGGIVAALFLLACCCSMKKIITDRRRVLKKREERHRAKLEYALGNTPATNDLSGTVIVNGFIDDAGLQRTLSEDEDDAHEEHVICATVHQAFSEPHGRNGDLSHNHGDERRQNGHAKPFQDVITNGHPPNGISRDVPDSNGNTKPPFKPRLSYDQAISNYIRNVTNNKVPQKRTRSKDRIIHPAEDLAANGEETYHHYDDVTDFSSGNVNQGFEQNVDKY